MEFSYSSSTETAAWSNDEKFKLLGALNLYGPSQVDKILTVLPGKTVREVQIMVKRYERLANYHPNHKIEDDAPIDKWTQVMRMHTDFNRLGPIPRALKYLALFEERKEGEINLTDIYSMLSDISQGTPPKQLDNLTSNYLYDVFQKLAKKVQNSEHNEEMNYLDQLGSSIQMERTYNRKQKSKEDITINPLLVPKALYRKKK